MNSQERDFWRLVSSVAILSRLFLIFTFHFYFSLIVKKRISVLVWYYYGNQDQIDILSIIERKYNASLKKKETNILKWLYIGSNIKLFFKYRMPPASLTPL